MGLLHLCMTRSNVDRNDPTITIVTVSLNAVAHIDQTIKSLLINEYPKVELILIDGGSTDGTINIINTYKTFFHAVISEQDGGISDAFNKGIRNATGDIIGLVSADDYLLPGALEAVAECFLVNDRPDVIHGNVVYLDMESGKKSVSRPDVSLKSAFVGQPVKHGATFVARAAYEKYGVFDTRYKCAMDYDLILRMIVRGARFVYIDQELEVLRTGGISQRRRELTRRESREISIRHGCSPLKANAYYHWKVAKDVAKSVLKKTRGTRLLEFYRKLRGRNVLVP